MKGRFLLPGSLRIFSAVMASICSLSITTLPGCGGYSSKVELYTKYITIWCEEKHEDGACEMRSDPVHGRVIDRRTGNPLEGVVVMGYWPKSLTRYYWRVTVGVAHLAETLSDPSGRFEIPACDPPCGMDGYFAPYQPDILFFKEGYYPKAVSNRINHIKFDKNLAEHRRWIWDWSGKDIELEPVGDENDPRLKAAYTLSPRLYLQENCNWMKIPRTLLYKAREMQRRESDPDKAAMAPALYLAENHLMTQEQCHPDPAVYLTEISLNGND